MERSDRKSAASARGGAGLALAALVTASGCSLILVDGPSARVPPTGPSCTTSSIGPVLDVAVTTFFAGGTYITATRLGEVNGDSGAVTEADIVPPFVLAALFGGSAVWGVLTVRRCLAAFERWDLAPAPAPGVAPIEPSIAFCATLTRLDGEQSVACRPSAAACIALRSELLATPDVFASITECEKRP